ncbi:MAG TPA: hypothetical protein VH208_08375 [Myxococcaceae bacterium]|nr:hypothetical protein [Myxococcaceae bacterium]
MKDTKLTRRTLLQSGAAAAGALATGLPGVGPLVGRAFGQVAPEQPAVLLVYLSGGYNALFPSGDSFIPAGSFSCTSSNTKSLGNGLVVDSSFASMPSSALQHMASIGVRHGLSSHSAAQPANWSTPNGQSYALQLAEALGGTAAIKCCVLGGNMIPGPHPAIGMTSLQQITDMGSTIAALGGATSDPTIPNRTVAANGLTASQTMSQEVLTPSPSSLVTMTDGYNASIMTLQQPAQIFSYSALAQAYGVSASTTAITNFTTKIMGAELMITAGANVVAVVDGGWDTHGDSSGTTVRNQMNSRILPPLNVFLSRMMAASGRNVVTAIFGDFSRSLPGSDHEPNLTNTVIGKYVQVGTTGKVMANVSLPVGVPSIPQFWAFLAAAAHCSTQPFGANPHALVS